MLTPAGLRILNCQLAGRIRASPAHQAVGYIRGIASGTILRLAKVGSRGVRTSVIDSGGPIERLGSGASFCRSLVDAICKAIASGSTCSSFQDHFMNSFGGTGVRCTSLYKSRNQQMPNLGLENYLRHQHDPASGLGSQLRH
jgi:hypothetical protein